MDLRSYRIALAVSVGLNVLAVGVIGGASVAWLRLGAAAGAHHPFRAAAQSLPPGERQRFVAYLKATAQAARPLRQAAREGRRDAASLFVAPSFDPSAVNASLTRARDADFQLRTRLEGGIVAFATTLPQADRRNMAAALAQGGPLRTDKGGRRAAR